jgi:hypothetical protein
MYFDSYTHVYKKTGLVADLKEDQIQAIDLASATDKEMLSCRCVR